MGTCPVSSKKMVHTFGGQTTPDRLTNERASGMPLGTWMATALTRGARAPPVGGGFFFRGSVPFSHVLSSPDFVLFAKILVPPEGGLDWRVNLNPGSC